MIDAVWWSLHSDALLHFLTTNTFSLWWIH
jgi:hypothetical protein